MNKEEVINREEEMNKEEMNRKNICSIKIKGSKDINIYTYPKFGYHIFPISLGIPKENILQNFPEKKIDFSSKIENKSINQYVGDNLEDSKFILITKDDFNNGEDNIIYYEALSKGCIPIFNDKINENTSVFLPKELFNIDRIKDNAINPNLILNYTKLYLTTECIAKYLLNIVNINVNKILFLAHSTNTGDLLLQQSLLHGLNKLGKKVIDSPKVYNIYKKYNINNTYSPYNNLLEEPEISRGRIDNRIKKQEFDIIIIMGIFTEKDKERLKLQEGEYPYSEIISSYYKPSKVLFIDGNNDKNNINRLQKYLSSGICFSKEF